jgi:formate hydrogenlyase transcriptional activator
MSNKPQPTNDQALVLKYRALLEVSESLASHYDLAELFRHLSKQLRLAVDFEAVIITLYDPQTQMMRRYLLESEIAELADLAPDVAVDNSLAGLVWQSQKPYVLNQAQDAAAYPALMKTLQNNDIRSACILPLTSSGHRLGTIGFGSRRVGAYNEELVEFLQPLANQVAVAIDNTLNFEQARTAEQQAKDQSERLQLMLKITNTVVSQLDLRELLQVISSNICEALDADTAGVGLYDPESNQLLTFATELPEGPGIPIPFQGTTGGLAFTTGQPVFVDKPDAVRFHSDYARRIVEAGYLSGGSIPLIAQGRKLGVLGVASKRENSLSREDKEFLVQVANQVAIAVENALNFEQARTAEQQAKRQSERERLMLEINNAIVSQLDLRELLQVISPSIRDVIGCDTVGVLLFDEESQQLRAFMSDFPPDHPLAEQGLPIALEGSPSGLAFTTGQPVYVDKPDLHKFDSDLAKRVFDEGIQSGVCIPLLAKGSKLGVLGVTSKRQDAFSDDDKALLIQIANQVAIAVDNALNFERARKAEQESRRQFERERLMLEINKAVVSQLDLRELVRVVSSCLREALQLDISSVSLYDPEINQLRAYWFDLSEILPPIEEGTPFTLEGNVGGVAFTSGKPIFINRTDPKIARADFDRRIIEAGIRSGGCVPLIVQDRKLGILAVGSFREEAFPEADQELICHIANQIAIAVENALNFERARKAEQEVQRKFERERLMLEINNAVVTILDLGELVKTISASLHDIMPHEAAGIALYEPELNHLREYSNVTYKDLNIFREGEPIPLEGTPAGQVFLTGQPLLLRRLNPDKYPADRYSQRPDESTPKSACLVPLISHGRKLGIVGVSSTQEEKFTEADLELLGQIAGQIAIAVDNALNFERARQSEQQAIEQSEQLQLLLEINNAVVSNLDLRSLMTTIATYMRTLSHYDSVGMALYDPDTNQLRAYANPINHAFIEQGELIPLEGSIIGMTFTTGQPILLDNLEDERFYSDFSRRIREAGFKSGGCVPLIAHGRKLGSLGVSSYREIHFTKSEVELLCQVANQVAIAVENALAFREIEALKNKLTSEKLYLEDEIQTEYNFSEIIGQSTTLKRILKQVETVAPTDSVVLIQGETGTGKELIARAIHNLSARRERTMVKLNCAAIPTGLLESELFGHEKGAFTGAVSQRVGRFELANKGTLFLDEVGDIPLELQPKLLRVLQESEFERLGSSRTIRADVRLIAATNCDLAQMVEEKKYRGDLFYRLNVFPLRLPPLRERLEDIPLLVGYFIQKHSRRMNKRITTVRADDMEVLNANHWSGNVRELENFIERAVILSKGNQLEVPLAELRKPIASPHSDKPTAAQTKLVSLEANERAHIQEILRHTNGVIGGKGGAAEILDLPVSTLRSRMKKLGLM